MIPIEQVGRRTKTIPRSSTNHRRTLRRVKSHRLVGKSEWLWHRPLGPSLVSSQDRRRNKTAGNLITSKLAARVGSQGSKPRLYTASGLTVLRTYTRLAENFTNSTRA